MLFRFVLPDIGEGVVEAEVQRWYVKPGDHVVEDQPLVEVMTDKATVTIPSPRRGTVTRLLHEVGQVAKVHQPMLEMVEDARSEHFPSVSVETAPAEAAPAVGAPAPLAEAAGQAPPRKRALATPAVRALARQMGVDIQGVPGTGAGGRVTKEDLARVRNGHGAPAQVLPAGEGDAGDGEALPPGATGATPPQRAAPFADELPRRRPTSEVEHGDEVVPLRGLRRRMAERMAQSKRTAAHFTFVEQADVTDLVKVKERISAAAAEQGVKVTFLPFFVKAAVAALRRHPWLNATLDEARGEVRLRRDFHIGIASATEQGLLVPVVRHADRLSLLNLAQEIERLAAESKAGRARPEEMGGSTFTITSLGAEGGLFATPIINFPEVAILGIHRIRPTPVVREGQIVARDVMHVSLSCDHRVVDGHMAADFAYALIRYLEDPNLLFMEMV
jgi:pyruvate dehydrogenase E2 component (dihydrolipoamide acetyltransferase)